MTQASGNAIAYLGRTDAGAVEAPEIGLVPADRVSVVDVELPDVRGAKLTQALRWAAEDALAGDAEHQHVVPVERREDGRMVCAVATREDMQRWCAEAPDLTRLVPDAAALPWQDGQLVLAASGDKVLARWGRHAFDRLDADLLDALLPDLVEQARPTSVIWFGDALPDSLATLDPERRSPAGSMEDLLAEGATTSSMNLLHGEFAPAADRAQPRIAWTAGLFLVAALLLIGDAALEVVQLDARSTALQAEIEGDAAAAFPDIQLMPGRERAQLERAVGGPASDMDGFVRVLRRVGPLFGALDALTVESMTWSDGRLEMTLRAPGLPDLEALQRQVEQRGLRARVDDVAVESGSVRGRMIIEARATS